MVFCNRFPLVLACLASIALISPASAEEKPLDFAHDVLPLLKARCAECHTNGVYKGGFSLDTREAALRGMQIAPGKSASSELIDRISSTDADLRMPPKGPPLTAAEVAIFRRWIDGGLRWEPGFSFLAAKYVPPLRPRKVELPPAQEGRVHPIDRIIDAYYTQRKITPPQQTSDSVFLRRAHLDLIGLLPTEEEIDAFLADPASDKRTRLIDKLLAERVSYAEHWLSFWNDLLRNDYRGTGYIDGGRKQISAWLYQSLLDNKPYDQFVRELINPRPDAEGFIAGIKWRGRVNASQEREIQFSQNVSQVFFGVNMKCASCHDSFIDSWKLDDAYSLAAVIAEAPLEIHRCDVATGQQAQSRFLWPELGAIDPAAPKAKRLEQLAGLVTHPENGRFARTIVNRLWQRLFGRGIVHPVDMMANRPWDENLLDYLANYLVEHQYDLQQLLRHVCNSHAYQSQHDVIASENAVEEFVFRGPQLKQLSAEQFLDAIWMLTGTAPAKRDIPVPAPAENLAPLTRKFTRASVVNSNPLLRSLGRPNREQVVTVRGDVLTTLQALDLANGEIVASTLTSGGGNLLKQTSDSDQLVASLYRRALCREPTADENALARELLGEKPTPQQVADLLWIIFLQPEFQLIR
jgi:hypothetical protein